MIIEKILDLIYKLIDILMVFQIPSLGEDTTGQVKDMLTTAFNACIGFVDIFIPWNVVKILLPIAIVIINAEHIYNFIMWILRKIPFLGMS